MLMEGPEWFGQGDRSILHAQKLIFRKELRDDYIINKTTQHVNTIKLYHKTMVVHIYQLKVAQTGKSLVGYFNGWYGDARDKLTEYTTQTEVF